jgi:DNA-binding YbaB/EbfC family protein
MSQMNPGDLVKQLNRMRRDMDKVKTELKERYVEASVADDLVEVTVNGQQEVVRVSIDPKAVAAGADGQIDLEMLEDLIIAAVNQGIEKSKDLMNEEMNKATGGMVSGFPGLF